MSQLRTAAAEPWDVVRRLNEAWRTNQLETLQELFHEHAVIVDAAHQRLAIGRTACVESYRAFVSTARVEEYTEQSPTVELFGPVAVVTYPFRIHYMVGDRTYDETGSDCLMLIREARGWLVAWRQLVWRAA